MTTSDSMRQNSPIRTPGPMPASGETTAVGATTADGSMGMNSYDKRRWKQTGKRVQRRDAKNAERSAEKQKQAGGQAKDWRFRRGGRGGRGAGGGKILRTRLRYPGVAVGSHGSFGGRLGGDPFAQGVEEEFQLDRLGEGVVHARRRPLLVEARARSRGGYRARRRRTPDRAGLPRPRRRA